MRRLISAICDCQKKTVIWNLDLSQKVAVLVLRENAYKITWNGIAWNRILLRKLSMTVTQVPIWTALV